MSSMECRSENELDSLLTSFVALELSQNEIDMSQPYDFKGDYRMSGQSYRKSTNEETEWRDVLIQIDGNKINGHGNTKFRNKEMFFILIGKVTKWVDAYPYEIKFIKFHPEINHSISYKGIIKENSIAFYNDTAFGYLEFNINISNLIL